MLQNEKETTYYSCIVLKIIKQYLQMNQMYKWLLNVKAKYTFSELIWFRLGHHCYTCNAITFPHYLEL